ncbi:MAG: thermosome subunit [Euryarchaeota archaeon]|nr:thermosome subunit [Euryarchaeota archaeon]
MQGTVGVAMSDTTILDETDRTTGRDALRKNIQAAIALAGAVRSTLGPKGLDKLLVDDEGRSMVTNDGITVLESAKVEHPIAHMLIASSAAQDQSVRDGTTTTVLLASEWLQNAWHLVVQGVHPATIARGFRMAESFCKEHLDELSFEATKNDIEAATMTSLSGKLHQKIQSIISACAVEAADAVVMESNGSVVADPTRVKVITRSGPAVEDSKLITGLALPKKRAHVEMPSSLPPGNILLVDGGLELRSLSTDVHLNVTSTSALKSFQDAEQQRLLDQVKMLVDLEIKLLACREGIDDSMHAYLADAGIKAFRRVAKSDLELLARGCGARLVPTIHQAKQADVGVFISSRCERWGDVDHWILETDEGGATFVASGSTDAVVGEVERCFADALGVACRLKEHPKLIPGGGATYIALARRLRRYAETVPGREQLAIEAFADGLESIPRILAENAGMDPIDTLLQIVSIQTKDEDDTIGLNAITRQPENMRTSRVVEPVRVLEQAICGANEATIAILRIDDVLWAKQEIGVPDDVQANLDGTAPDRR